MNQNELVKYIATGNQKAFQKLYQLFSDKVYNTALSYTLNENDAEEVTQDVFVKLFKNAAKFRGDAMVGTWIYRITVNTALNQIKKNKKYSFLSFGEKKLEVIDFEHPGVLVENKENATALFNAIFRLPESQKTAFILSFVEELPRQEVADVMGNTLKAVESLLQRAKKKLRMELGKMYPHRV